MVYKRQLFFQYSRPSGCDTSKLLSDDLKNKLYYDGFQKMLYHYSHQCDLRKADFRDATGYKVDILGSRMKDARFSLPEAVNLLADLKIKLS